MNRASNSCISSPKFQIDPFLSSLNHLIVVGPRLDGNSLYINPSLLKRYHLYIMTYMLNWIDFSIINDKLWIGKPPKHLCALYLFRKRWLGRPPLHSTHNIESRVIMTISTITGRFASLLGCLIGSFPRMAWTTASRWCPWNVVEIDR